METTPGNRDLGCRSSRGATKPNSHHLQSWSQAIYCWGAEARADFGRHKHRACDRDRRRCRELHRSFVRGKGTRPARAACAHAQGTHTRARARTARSLTPPPNLRKRDHSITRDSPLGPLLRTHPSAPAAPRGPAAPGRSGVCRGLRPAVSRAWRVAARRHLARPPILIARLKSPPGVFPEQNVSRRPLRPLRVASHRQESACKPLPAHPVP